MREAEEYHYSNIFIYVLFLLGAKKGKTGHHGDDHHGHHSKAGVVSFVFIVCGNLTRTYAVL